MSLYIEKYDCYPASEGWDIEPEPEPEDNGYIHESDLTDLERLCEHVRGIAEAFYESGDIMKLESCLDEVCYELDVPINKGEPVMEKKNRGDLMQWHLGYQQALIDLRRR